MKRSLLILIIGIIAALAVTGTASADISKAEKNLERESKRLNDTAAKPDGEKAVLKRIKAEFKIEDAQIQALRDRKLAYGEIATALSLAQKMPGGVIEVNVQKVLSMRQGPPIVGWGQVARQLETKLGATVSQVKKMCNDSNREIKKDQARSGKAGKDDTKAQQEQPLENKDPEPPSTFKGEGRPMSRGGGAM
jgi:Skp family chaperone for outer membrane proteins